MRIAVLMTCFNRKETTLSCIKSLYDSIEHDHENTFQIFLVDDGSTDGTSETIKDKNPEVAIIHGNGNLFWNRGMNLAWKTAAKNNFDCYLWLNDDVILFKDSITILLNDSIKKNNEAIIVGGCQSSKGLLTYSGYVNITKKKKLKPNGNPLLCDFFNGNIVLIPSKVFKQVGFLNPLFHHGQGDFEYGLRAKKLGINSFISSCFVGECESHNDLPIWCNPKYSITKRWKNFKSPKGGNPKSTFIFQKKYMGLLPAIFHYFTIHLRLLYPKLWTKYYF